MSIPSPATGQNRVGTSFPQNTAQVNSTQFSTDKAGAATEIASALLRNSTGRAVPSASISDINSDISSQATKARKIGFDKLSTTDSHASASSHFKAKHLKRRKTTALQTDSIIKQLKSIKSLELTDLLHTHDDGRVHSKVQKFPTADPKNPLKIRREVVKTPDIGNMTLISSNKPSIFKNKKSVDRSYSPTDLTFAAASAHYKRKDGIDLLSAGPLKHTTSTEQAKKLGESIAAQLSALDGKTSMGISVDMETDSEHAPHRLSVALKTSKEDGSLTIVVHDSVKGSYESWEHGERVEAMLSGMVEEFNKQSHQEEQHSPLILVANDKNVQNDRYACGTVSIVALKELLKNDGALIDEMTTQARENQSDTTTNNSKIEIGLPPSIYRMIQSPERITDEEKSVIFRPDKGKSVQEKLDEFSLPNGKVEFSVKKESFPPHWSNDDIARTVGIEGYTQKEEGVFTKTVSDPQNGYLRAKSLAFAQLAIDIAKDSDSKDEPKKVLQSMFAKVHIPCPDG